MTQGSDCSVSLQQSRLGSFRQLLNVFEAKYDNSIASNLEKCLRDHIPSFRKLLRMFNPPTESSLRQIECGQIKIGKTALDKSQSQFIKQLSEFLHLDLSQCWITIKSYIELELRLADDSDFNWTLNHLEPVIEHYYDERLSLLSLVASLIRSENDEGSPYHSIALIIVEESFRDIDFPNLLLDQIMDLMNAKPSSHFENYPHLLPLFIKHTLEEEKSLLELLFISYYNIDNCSPDRYFELLQLFQEKNYGRNQPCRDLCHFECEAIFEEIEQICLFILIETLFLENLVEKKKLLQANENGNSFLEIPEKILQLISAMENLDPTPIHSVLWLTCGMFLYRVGLYLETDCTSPYEDLKAALQSFSRNPADGTSGVLYQQFLMRGLNNNGIGYILLTLERMKRKDHPNIVGYHSVLKSLFDLILISFEINQLPNYNSIVECVRLLYNSQPELCDLFWLNTCSSNDVGFEILETALGYFPVNFHNFTTLLASICGGSLSSSNAFDYLCKLEKYAEMSIDSKAHFEIQHKGIDGNSIWMEEEHSVGFCNSDYSLIIPPKVSGKVISKPGEEWIVLWECQYSPWGLLLNILASYIIEPSSMFSKKLNQVTSDFIKNPYGAVEDILLLIESFLKAKPDTLSILKSHPSYLFQRDVDIISIFTKIFDRTFTLPKNSSTSPIRVSCLKCMQIIGEKSPALLWYSIRKSYFFSSVMAPKVGSLEGFSFDQHNGVLLLDNSGVTFPVTLNFLNLIDVLAKEVYSIPDSSSLVTWNDQFVILGQFLTFLQNSIFPYLETLSFTDSRERFQLSSKILMIYNEILEFQHEKKNSKPCEIETLISLQTKLKKFYLGSNDAYHISPLLNIISIGPRTIQYFCRRQMLKAAEELEILIVEALRFAVHLLNHDDDDNENQPAYLFEQKMLTGKASGKRDLLATLSDYLCFSDKDAIHVNTLKLMSLLFKDVSKWKPRPPSLISHFADNALLITAAFGRLLLDNSSKPEIHYSIWEFITICAKTQPALALLFLRGETLILTPKDEDQLQPSSTYSTLSLRPREGEDSLPKFQHSILPILLKILKSSVTTNNGPRLYGLMVLLVHLWQSPQEHVLILNYLRENASFWSSFSDILFSSMDEIPNHVKKLIQANILRIIGMEIFYNSVLEEENNQKIQFRGNNEKFSQLLEKIFNKNTFQTTFSKILLLSLDPKIKDDFDLFMPVFEPFAILNCTINRHLNVEFDINNLCPESYLYNTDFVRRIFKNQMNSSQHEQGFLRLIKLNENWATSDAELVLVRSAIYFLEIGCRGLCKSDIWRKLDPGEALYALLSTILDILTEDSRSGLAIDMYHLELSRLVLSQLSVWTEALSHATIQLQKIEELLTQLSSCLQRLAGFPDFFATMEELLSNLLTSCVILCQLSAKKDPNGKFSDSLVRQQLLSSCCVFLVHTLQTENESQPLNHNYLEIQCSLFVECITHENHLHPSRWLLVLQQHDVILNLQKTYVTCLSFPEPLKHILTVSSILHIFITLAGTTPAAERLAINGIMNTFNNNPLSPILQEGHLETHINGEQNPWHKIWCLSLNVVRRMLTCLGVNAQFLETVGTFIQLHEPQFIKSLNLSTLEVLSVAHLEDAEAVSQLLHQFAIFFNQQRALRIPSFLGFIQLESTLLGYFSYLLTHPAFLESRLEHTEEGDCNMQQNGSENPSHPEEVQKDVCRSFFSHPKEIRKMLDIIQNIGFTFHLLLQWPPQIRQECNMEIVLLPAMNVSTLSGATLGNVYDFINYLMAVLSKLLHVKPWVSSIPDSISPITPSTANSPQTTSSPLSFKGSKSPDPTQAMNLTLSAADVGSLEENMNLIYLLESSLLLFVSQLVTCLTLRNIPVDMKQALRIETGKECKQVLIRIQELMSCSSLINVSEAVSLKEVIPCLKQTLETVLSS